MNPNDERLNRLLQAASRAPKPQAGGARFTLEARVLGQWRASLSNEGGDFLLSWFRRAAIGACVLALVSLAWNYSALTGSTGDELAAADSAMRIGVAP
jgi:hypothetical protein